MTFTIAAPHLKTQPKTQPKTQLKPLQQDFSVRFTYDVHFTQRLFDTDNPLLADVLTQIKTSSTQVFVVVDSGVAQAHPQLVSQIKAYARRYSEAITLVAEPLIVPGGEIVKQSAEWVEKIQDAVNRTAICRHSYVMAIGGGAVLDMAGYAAATAHRGVRLIRVPTTVLAQNDSGVGVKNGINAFGKKNFLGAFAPPTLVFNDFDFLKALGDRDWRSGIPEAVKVALIKDADFFSFIETSASALDRRNMEAMKELVYRCAKHHVEHIGGYGDPFEKGSSRPLDFGHWAAHRLEHLTDYALRHGEAVAIGIALDSTYSYLQGHLDIDSWQRILSTLQTLGFELYVPELSSYLNHPSHPDSIFRGLSEFREHLGGELTIMLLKAIGVGFEVHAVDFDVYRQAIALLQES
ncbi:3-dehydroquinate synthase [cf. Phormidesmis sp. LEGE 11477]|uniref:3-dehydroquinate synthase n=1 Tax=cf. Phormidesmis sp. LEGE 11477 TaxID=1828680 RepID=UPI00187EA5ED|nr:3-dehydroquinate synthase [cf. Phormidesmis sp. LEGE 11477]MBE9059808.1 3-dehydroquinate synthase [cf. Phormidesmis sp. LEGE 11477]